MAEHTPYTPAQLALRRTMEQVSAAHWAAGWYSGLATILWRQLQSHGPAGQSILSPEERMVLRWLCEQAAGWWHWPKGAAEPAFIGAQEWQQLAEDKLDARPG